VRRRAEARRDAAYGQLRQLMHSASHPPASLRRSSTPCSTLAPTEPSG
jgi:hypothetical protein